MELEVVNEEDQHFIMRFDRPARIEVSVIEGIGKIIAHAYSGYDTDMEQDPDLVFDGTI